MGCPEAYTPCLLWIFGFSYKLVCSSYHCEQKVLLKVWRLQVSIGSLSNSSDMIIVSKYHTLCMVVMRTMRWWWWIGIIYTWQIYMHHFFQFYMICMVVAARSNIVYFTEYNLLVKYMKKIQLIRLYSPLICYLVRTHTRWPVWLINLYCQTLRNIWKKQNAPWKARVTMDGEQLSDVTVFAILLSCGQPFLVVIA